MAEQVYFGQCYSNSRACFCVTASFCCSSDVCCVVHQLRSFISYNAHASHFNLTATAPIIEENKCQRLNEESFGTCIRLDCDWDDLQFVGMIIFAVQFSLSLKKKQDL